MTAYLIGESELGLLREKWGELDSTGESGSAIYLRAWICRIRDEGRTVDVIVSDAKPTDDAFQNLVPVKEARTPSPDELEPSSRQDSAWGDLKLFAKKAAREATHALGHDQSLRAHHRTAPNQITLHFQRADGAANLVLRHAYYFRLSRESKRLINRRYAFELDVDAASAESPNNIAGGLRELLQAKYSWGRRLKRMSLALGIGTVVVTVLALLGGQSRLISSQEPSSRTDEPRITTETKVPFLTESCSEVAAIFAADSPYSSVQKEAMWKRYAGKPFKWSVEVLDVESTFLGDYRAHLRCYPSSAVGEEVEMEFPQSTKSQALSLGKGRYYSVEGVLDAYGSRSGLLTAEALMRDVVESRPAK